MITPLSSHSIQQMNQWGATATPFLFVIDFECQKPLLFPLSAVPSHIHYHLPWFPTHSSTQSKPEGSLHSKPISLSSYTAAFNRVQHHLQHGDTYLLNLTMPTPISPPLNMAAIYAHSDAPYRLLIQEQMVCFSPETFVRIQAGRISSYPMKGTIDTKLPQAAEQLLSDPKETAEHNTIVDLIRNDLSMVAKKVRLKRYRYLDTIHTHKGSLLQMSSEIEGQLPTDYAAHIGNIIAKLLPAGSISGAPKEKTVAIIQATEKQRRGYYTGVFGVFDGQRMDSAVMIRYIEQNPAGQQQYRSGGGITAQSQCHKEYQEMIDKVYVPIIRKHTH